MSELFTAVFFKGNRQRLKKLVKVNGPIVITASGQLQKAGDENFPFHQDANFWYLTGINEPDFVLVIDKDEEYLIAPERSKVLNLFGGEIDLKSIQTQSGIKLVLPAKNGWHKLDQCLQAKKRVATLAASQSYIKVIGMYTNPARARLIQKLKRLTRNLKFEYIGEALASLRVIKQTPEVKAIRRAVDITCEAFKTVQNRKYDYEYQLEADLSQLFRTTGAQGHAYEPIVAGGLNACTIHYMKNNAKLKSGELILVDAGARYGQYAADITRTWAQAKPNQRQKDVIAAVSEITNFGLDQLSPGISFRDCEQKVRQYTGVKLKELRLIENSKDKTGIARYYPHAPHYLGLNVHDVGDYSQPLEPGMVLTVEPGIYIKEEGIGVRIEDDVLITQSGCEVLSKNLPREL